MSSSRPVRPSSAMVRPETAVMVAEEVRVETDDRHGVAIPTSNGFDSIKKDREKNGNGRRTLGRCPFLACSDALQLDCCRHLTNLIGNPRHPTAAGSG